MPSRSPVYLLALWQLCFLYGPVFAYFSLYTDRAENKKLLGVEATVLYVDKGNPVQHALDSTVFVFANVSSLQFWWTTENTTTFPVRVQYTLSVAHERSEALGPWGASIKLAGTVPKQPTSFTVTLPCVAKSTEPVSFTIEFEFTGGKTPLSVDLPRKKFCSHFGSVSAQEEPPVSSSPLTEKDEFYGSVQSDPSSLPESGNVYLTAGIVLVLFLAFILVVIAIVCKSKGKPNTEVDEEAAREAPLLMPEAEILENAYVASPKHSVIGSVQFYDETASRQSAVPPNSMFVPSLSHAKDIRSFEAALRELDVDPRYVQVGEVVIAGTFGIIRRGLLLGDHESREVLIKSVKPATAKLQSDLMLMEGIMLYAILHPNVSELVGVVSRMEEPMVLFSGSAQENLKIFLGTNKVRQLGLTDLVRMSVDILAGLEFLHRKNHVHKDIAARNCLKVSDILFHQRFFRWTLVPSSFKGGGQRRAVSSRPSHVYFVSCSMLVDDRRILNLRELISPDLKIQVSDNALARDLFPNDYQCLGDNENRPVKWLAYESLVFGQFHPPSDVLMSLGQNPYFEIDAFEIEMVLQNGYRLLHPANCPDDLYEVMKRCWYLKPELRPTTLTLFETVATFQDNLANYI